MVTMGAVRRWQYLVPIERSMSVMLLSIVTCPHCSRKKEETMPQDRCVIAYTCTGCGEVLRPRRGDCCIFCSYGSAPCPSKQAPATSRPSF
jgi:hypothetical protein